MIRAIYRTPDGTTRSDVKPEEFAALLGQPGGVLWADFVEEPEEACEPILRETFGFHPLAVSDALVHSHVPKIDDWEGYVYLVLHAVSFEAGLEARVNTQELDVFVGANYVVTYQAEHIDAVQRVWEDCLRDERHLDKGATRLLYRLADELVLNYLPVVESIDRAIDAVEDEVFGNPRQDVLAQVFTLKRSLLHLRRIIPQQRHVLNRLARGDYAVVDAEERVYFRDLYDHLVRLYDLTEGLRDLAAGVQDAYLSVVNNRINEVVKTLTFITTMFMPIAFLTGFFGMNFFQPLLSLEAATGRAAFWPAMAAILAIPLGMYLWMRRRAWM